MNERKAYPSDLKNEEWQHIQILLPKPQGKGRRRSPAETREQLNAIWYVLSTGCQWRALPHDFPAWQTVYGYFLELSRQGVWEEINQILRRGLRGQEGREAEPSVLIMDSQSVKTSEKKAIAVDLTAPNASKGANAI